MNDEINRADSHLENADRRPSRIAAGAGLYVMVAMSSSLICLSSALAQTDTEIVNEVIAEQATLDQQARQSQQQIASLDEKTGLLLAEYRKFSAEAVSMKGYNDQLEAMVVSQQQEMESIEQQYAEIDTTSREVVPLIQRMLSTLESFVELDTPFLQEERRTRISTLKEILSRADVTTSEKYRRVLEAYNVEMEYGRTIEAYRTTLESGNDSLTVDFLRLGRVALMYQTLDGEQTGYWNFERKTWVVDNDYQRAVRQGLRIAKQQSAPGLLVVPVSSPQEN